MASSCGTGAISGAMGMGDDVAASASSSVASGCGQGAAPKTAAAGAVVGCGQEAAAAGCGQGNRRILSETQMRAWRAFLGASTLVSACLNHELDEAAAISMYEYEILVRLFESEAGRVRMSQLADQVSYSRSRLTHTVGRLERAGYVLRSSCPNDRRGVYAHLTQAGYEFLAQTAPIHLDGVRRHLIDRFTPSELDTLTELLEKITTDADLAH